MYVNMPVYETDTAVSKLPVCITLLIPVSEALQDL
jgi:hypothetical protein